MTTLPTDAPVSEPTTAVWFKLEEMFLLIEALSVPERVQVINDLADYFVALQGDRPAVDVVEPCRFQAGAVYVCDDPDCCPETFDAQGRPQPRPWTW